MGHRYNKATGTIIKLLKIHEKLKEASVRIDIERHYAIIELENTVSQKATYVMPSKKIIEFVYHECDDGTKDYNVHLMPTGHDIIYNEKLGEAFYALHRKTGRNKRRLVTVSKLMSLLMTSLDIQLMSNFEIFKEKSRLCNIII